MPCYVEINEKYTVPLNVTDARRAKVVKGFFLSVHELAIT